MQDCQVCWHSAEVQSCLKSGTGPGEASECKPHKPNKSRSKHAAEQGLLDAEGNCLVFWWIEAVAGSILFGDAVS